MSASGGYSSFIWVSLSPEPCADNYSHPLSWTPSHWSCLSVRLKLQELSAQHLKTSTARSGPVFNFTFDSSPPFFPLCHLSTPSTQPTHTITAEFHSGANLYFQDNHSFSILQSGRLNGNWQFNFGNETWESFWNRLFPCAPCSCPGAHSAFSSTAHHLLRPGLLTTVNFSASVWRHG